VGRECRKKKSLVTRGNAEEMVRERGGCGGSFRLIQKGKSLRKRRHRMDLGGKKGGPDQEIGPGKPCKSDRSESVRENQSVSVRK